MLQTYGVLREVAVVIVLMMTATPGNAGTSSVFGRLHEALCNALEMVKVASLSAVSFREIKAALAVFGVDGLQVKMTACLVLPASGHLLAHDSCSPPRLVKLDNRG